MENTNDQPLQSQMWLLNPLYCLRVRCNIHQMTKTIPNETTLRENCCDTAGPSNIHQMTKTIPNETTLQENCCGTAGPGNIHQMTKTIPNETTLQENCCDTAGPGNIHQMTKTIPNETTLQENCCDTAGPGNIHQMTKTTPKEATLLEPCCDTAGPSKIHQMTKTTPKEATLLEPCCDTAGPSKKKKKSSVIQAWLRVKPLLLRIEKSQRKWLSHLFRMPPGRLHEKVFRVCPTDQSPLKMTQDKLKSLSLSWLGNASGSPARAGVVWEGEV
ncbi:uncharacterized protein LOC127597958 isoform X15 [Hippocampus zosterae]|uniref:uncharacterized protein LOC127597958 isoform X15 n=1 Tax=Hippocampus zosterae TaxID=109293 RepID=UPI00223D0B4B|nr:uncharacterized protein LOC127597958 isoform X15 [Hippocampus zosterae]